MTDTRLGGGSFGEVFVALWRGVPVAVKQFHTALVEVSNHVTALLKQELSICARVHHPNVVSICGAITVNGVPLQLVMELLEASLSEVMAAAHSSSTYLSFREQIDLSIDCLSGVMYLHELCPALLHGDIRPTNVLVTAMMEAKIGDLGSAHVIDHELSCGPLSLDYVAPERMPGLRTYKRNTKEADVYSLGVTLAEIFTGQEASKKRRERQFSCINEELIVEACYGMTEDAPEARIPLERALTIVRVLKGNVRYQDCPVKRMVKGKLYDPNGPVLVEKSWK
jgi:serine/threonine protein kinase